MRVVEEELEQLKLTVRENRFLSLVAQYPAVWIEPQPLELPNSLIPEVQPAVVAGHLVLDEGDIHFGRFLCHWMQFRQFSLHPVQEAEFEANQVVINAHPMAGIFPMLGLDVLALERTLGRCQREPGFHRSHYTELDESAVAELLTPDGVGLPCEPRRGGT